jgi:hypothetical protein
VTPTPTITPTITPTKTPEVPTYLCDPNYLICGNGSTNDKPIKMLLGTGRKYYYLLS